MTVRAATAVSLAAALALSACGGDDKPEQGAQQTPTPSASPTSTTSLPTGVTLTSAGTNLSFGDTATVEYSPNQSKGTILELTVEGATRGRLSDFKGFDLTNPYRKNAHYYYVDVTVENVGDQDLGGRDVPLWGVNQDNTLLPPVVFVSAFKKCPTEKLPRKFRQGDSFSTCLVFLSPDKGDLTAVSYRPDESVAPIRWTGTVSKPKAAKGDGKRNRG